MYSQLKFIQEEINNLPRVKLYSLDSTLTAGLPVFGGKIRNAVTLIIKEPEILSFAFLQWCCTVLAYFIWVQAFAIIPEGAADDTAINLAFFAWSLIIVGAVSFPLGILNGAIGASYFFKALKKKSTFNKCLKAASRRYWSLWIFSWVDNWITLGQILERLPKKNDPTPFSVKVVHEVFYLAWKSATLAVIPAVLLGKDLLQAAEESLAVFKSRLREVFLLRAGYSALCWIVGLLTYLIVFYLAALGYVPVEKTSFGRLDIYLFYLYAGFPVVGAAGVVHIFLRPIFLIASCEIYVNFLRSRNAQKDSQEPASPEA